MSRFIAIANQKGGVGKTTTTVNLAASLARFGRRVLVLDMDPQGNASSGLGVAANMQSRGIYEVLTGSMSVEEALTAQASPGVDLLPSGQRLIGAEVELVSALARERILEKAIHPIRDKYDILLADCPPSLGLLTVNTLTAADTILIPMQCEYYALEGLTQLLNTIKLIQQALNPRLEIEGILLTMFDARLNLSHEVAEETRKYFPGRVYETIIPRNVRLSEAPSFGKPVLEYDPECAGAQFYLKLGREVLKLPADTEPLALTQDVDAPHESEERTEAPVPREESVESVSPASTTEDVHADIHSDSIPDSAQQLASETGPEAPQDVPVSALDRDALEVAEIAARLIEADPAPIESAAAAEVAPAHVKEAQDSEARVRAEFQEVVEGAIEVPAIETHENTMDVPSIEVGENAIEASLAETAEMATEVHSIEAANGPREWPVGVAVDADMIEAADRQIEGPADDQGYAPQIEEPVVLSANDLADDVPTLSEDSIVLEETTLDGGESSWGGDPVANDPIASDKDLPIASDKDEANAAGEISNDPETRYTDLQPMTTQDAHHPQEELVSHD